MYRFEVYRLYNGQRHIAVHFPFRLLAEFKAAVHHSDRTWFAGARAWHVTPNGFRTLADAHGDQFQPIPHDVLELAYPDRSAAPTKLRMANGVDPGSVD